MLNGRQTVVPARLLAAELSESQASLRVFLTAAGLAVLGVILFAATVWWWRSTRPETPVLGPLEVMGDRRWRKAPDNDRRRLIDVHRPSGALALDGVAAAPDPVDLSLLARNTPAGFDDLRDPGPDDLADLVDLAALVSMTPNAGADAGAPPAEALPYVPGDWHAQFASVGPADFAPQLPPIPANGEGHVDPDPDSDSDDGNGAIDPLLQRATSSD
jgi:hypothetical protein